MHSPEAGNRAGNLVGVLRPLTAGPSGSGASPRFSGWPVRPGSCGTLSCTKALVPRVQISSGLLSRPAPDGLIGIEVRAVGQARALPSCKRGFTSRIFAPARAGPSRYSRTDLPTHAPARCPRSHSVSPSFGPAVCGIPSCHLGAVQGQPIGPFQTSHCLGSL